jgi:hypothetical protein
VIDAIRPVAPTRLFVACDGPNPERPGEAEKVAATRAVIDHEIDWPCQIERLYSDVNQGCRLGVSCAITWFFEQVEEGIILEDDCVPHPDFFFYCTSLLEIYSSDTRVWSVSGDNFQDGQWHGDGSYYFSHYPHCWGWASWRRCWSHYDDKLEQWPLLRDSGLLEVVFTNPNERKYWSNIWQRLYDDDIPDSWAFRWTFTCFANGGLTALPNENLVSNIGFGVDGTNCLVDALPTTIGSSLGNITHPSFRLRNEVADSYYFNKYLSPPSPSFLQRLKSMVRSNLKTLPWLAN